MGKKKTKLTCYMVCLFCAIAFVFAGSDMSVDAKTITTSITMGKGQTYTIDRSLSSKAAYKTSNKKVAAAKKGKITAKGLGTAKITIKDKKNTYVYNVTVSKVYLSKQNVVINKGNRTTIKVKGTKSKVKWSTSNKRVATVKNGTITAKKKGTATITAKVDKVKLKCKITVETPSMPANLTLAVGQSTILKVKGTNSNVKWSTSSKDIASVKNGKVTAQKEGTATISAKVNGNTFKCKVTVVNPSLSQTEITMKKGESTTLSVNGTTSEVTWNSSDSNIAAVDNGTVTAVNAGAATISAKVNDITLDCKVTVTDDNNPPDEVTPAPTPEETPTLSYEGYELKWSDDFNGDSLNLNDWNVETHEAGWVNSELQEYVDSNQNISVKDGNLIITPIKSTDANGNVTYTSGRINTQNKHDFTYGLFEVRAKVPAGQGYLPAFWMMPTNENLYGQWPRCGEIDIMEVMGQDTSKLYGTIHYGNPHSESQGTHILTEGSYSDEYHTFTCEWEPGSIKWYMDGILYHQENDWYSTTVGQGTITYPAPFDQPFYMILNLAVGGSWVGNPNETTNFDNAAFVVDYVKAYQKTSYDENVTKPVKDVVLRDPDASGNYVNNGNFANPESVTDTTDWSFMTANEGVGTAAISENAITISTSNEGTVDYSIQLVQAGIPFEKGASYRLSFNASASANRSIKTAIKAPDHGYSEYMASQTLDLTTTDQTFTYDFKMTSDSDPNGRLEFNMGAAGSTADVRISNVSIRKTKAADPNEKEVKTILADGNYVYNGSFQEGTNRLGYWEITNNADANVAVTNTNTIRRLQVSVSDDAANETDVVVGQSDLAIASGKAYSLSFSAQADINKTMTVSVGGVSFTANLTAEEQNYSFKIPAETVLSNKNIAFYMGTKGTIYLDDVRLVEDRLIKNGSFDAGIAGYEWYADSSADASYVIDSLTEDNALDVTIKNTSKSNWMIQLKQNNIELIKGQWYTLTFKAKSSLARDIRVVMQGLEAKGWPVYSGENTVTLSNDYQTFSKTFQMTHETDSEAFLSICLGNVDKQITTQHRVCIDDISLEKAEAPDLPSVEVGVNMFVNSDFSNGMKGWNETIANWNDTYSTVASSTCSDGSIIYNIENAGTADWHVQLKQKELYLESGCSYTVSFTANSTATRSILTGVQSESYTQYAGESEGTSPTLTAGTNTAVSFTFTANSTDTNAEFYISMGKTAEDTPASTITISNLSIIKNN